MSMKKYIGTKTIQAEQKSYFEFCREVKNGMIEAGSDDDPGYLVIYPDGYKSWSPADVFEKAYHELLFPDRELDAIGAEHRLEDLVFPSDRKTIAVAPDPDYGGAHRYQFQNSLGFTDGEAQYADDSFQEIQFVQKNADGTTIPGLQSEQLVFALLDRVHKLNARFPSTFNDQMIEGLSTFLDACQQRVQERIDRGVMGDLKK